MIASQRVKLLGNDYENDDYDINDVVDNDDNVSLLISISISLQKAKKKLNEESIVCKP